MAIRYLYNDQKYTSLWSLRQAIWANEHKAYGNPITQEEFNEIGINVTVEEYDPLDEMDLEALRARCLSMLEQQFTAYRNASTTYINSSLGFKANANITAYNNVDGILLQAEMSASTLSEGKVAFMDFDNQVQMLDAERIGNIAIYLGAGRKTTQDEMDYTSGIVIEKKMDDYIKKGETIAYIYTNDESKINGASKNILDAYALGKKMFSKGSAILAVMTK